MASFSVLYEDNDLLVVNKPAKREVEGPQKNSLVSDVNHYLRRAHSPHRAYLCHRLDKDTSGALLFAKGKENQKILMQQFKDGKVKKTYYAFVHGRPARPEAIINEAIAEKTHRGALVYKPAITKYKVLEYRAHYSVLAIEPLTGRTNQIRIHCKRIGRRQKILCERKTKTAPGAQRTSRRNA